MPRKKKAAPEPKPEPVVELVSGDDSPELVAAVEEPQDDRKAKAIEGYKRALQEGHDPTLPWGTGTLTEQDRARVLAERFLDGDA